MTDITHSLQTSVQTAYAQHTPLQIVGGQSKTFYGRASTGQVLNTAAHQGIIDYEPTELVITARAGTPLATIQQILAERGQWLAFEPPAFGESATFGGTIACGLSGAARPYHGAMRDFVLGVKCLNGQGDILQFGGQVMKNVAGYDVSRLMVGALGTLGVLLEISCKVMPILPEQTTRILSCSLTEALEHMTFWGNQTIPLTASCYIDGKLYLRLNGVSIQSAKQKIGGETLADADTFWADLREQRLAFFQTTSPLWRLSVPPTTPPLSLAGESLIEWGGGLRWLKSNATAKEIRASVAAVGGHATLFKGGDRHSAIFHPLPTPLDALHQRLKQQFDPKGILNPQRMAQAW
ncbi:glycolate oxidase subunit GlcE [Beggiatoa leptomitoformis]|uniref:Glycolate oxidase subunit GlcE n=1 Tax=Beggiatoa leptomitoformis TaxID=288004 RepID=A0A2N9YA76_9GAMM|nr:glycolate oxidase subunit GlcE [Beggiatoa leptomitoformis]ALG67229.1 glycolate oxidase subunit GlcE [Beggiatoa leptomitoformis]AUI67357.1 glycolate oxidase subunit GlcE [Beggiatoa leptomitoformis]